MSNAALRIFPPPVDRSALNPAASVWVEASAGSGKTNVLTQRVLSLLLEGFKPDSILCLTYTKAAAAEMLERVQSKLAEWAVMRPVDLEKTLSRDFGLDGGDQTLSRARRLFALSLEAPGGLNILTLHGFCQRLLQRFPLEAELAPHFAVLEDRDALELFQAARDAVLRQADQAPETKLGQALRYISLWVHDGGLDRVLDEYFFHEAKLAGKNVSPAAAAEVNAFLNLAPGLTQEKLIGQFLHEMPVKDLEKAAAILQEGSPKDQERGSIILSFLKEGGSFDKYRLAFLTKENEKRATLITKPLALKNPAIPEILNNEALRLQRYAKTKQTLTVAEATAQLKILASAIDDAYRLRKERLHALDYDDLIEKTLYLLARPGIAPWVLFKLDSAIDHILIDEAQDTSAAQWQIVKTIAGEFFSGQGAKNYPRTIFVVGDPKQSIYSFQHAEPGAFRQSRREFDENVRNARQEWEVLPLHVSYRSAPAILNFVDGVFANYPARQGVAPEADILKHQALPNAPSGIVEIWPLLSAPEKPELQPWAMPVQQSQHIKPLPRLAAAIAAKVADLTGGQDKLSSNGKIISPGDVMILVRDRKGIFNSLVTALKQAGVPIAGADRLILTQELGVLDLLALADFVLLPQDDYNLAALLKSPLCNISEEQLFTLAYNRATSLWNCVQDSKDAALIPAKEFLLEAIERSTASPYDFFSWALYDKGGKFNLLGRLGHESWDAIEELLHQALSFQNRHLPHLQRFIPWLRRQEVEIKRDFAKAERDEIRILTIHGAKGLEAPIVILPNTVGVKQFKDKILWDENLRQPIWLPRTGMAEALEATRERQKAAGEEESHRLLYVALTRAKERLYIAGYEKEKNEKGESWYDLLRQGAESAGAEEIDFNLENFYPGWQGKGWRLADVKQKFPLASPEIKTEAKSFPLPLWAREKITPLEQPMNLIPSRQERNLELYLPPEAPSPGVLSGRERGNLIHAAFHYLSRQPAMGRPAALQQLLARKAPWLGEAEKQTLSQEILSVMSDERFSQVFDKAARGEVPIIGRINGRLISGVMDRLLITPDKILLVDFKTNRPAPQSLAEVPLSYRRQMAAYAGLLRQIYPQRQVVSALLWTAIPKLMPLPEHWLALDQNPIHT
ncbi:MAG: double-strand break repair helicase AddA [Dongiaceae bacterium]